MWAYNDPKDWVKWLKKGEVKLPLERYLQMQMFKPSLESYLQTQMFIQTATTLFKTPENISEDNSEKQRHQMVIIRCSLYNWNWKKNKFTIFQQTNEILGGCSIKIGDVSDETMMASY